MTIDERILFLVQSTEPLHATAQELTGQVHEISGQVKQVTVQLQQLTIQVREHTRQLEIDAENIRRLANIAASHEQRLDDLEGGQTQ